MTAELDANLTAQKHGLLSFREFVMLIFGVSNGTFTGNEDQYIEDGNSD